MRNLIPSYNYSKGAKELGIKNNDSDRIEYIIYYQKVMYWNFANKDTDALVLITGDRKMYKEIEEEFGVFQGA